MKLTIGSWRTHVALFYIATTQEIITKFNFVSGLTDGQYYSDHNLVDTNMQSKNQ